MRYVQIMYEHMMIVLFFMILQYRYTHTHTHTHTYIIQVYFLNTVSTVYMIHILYKSIVIMYVGCTVYEWLMTVWIMCVWVVIIWGMYCTGACWLFEVMYGCEGLVSLPTLHHMSGSVPTVHCSTSIYSTMHDDLEWQYSTVQYNN